MAGYLDITIDAGATFNTSVTLTDVNGNSLNLASAAFNSQVKKSFITSNVAANIVVTIANTSSGVVYLGMDSLTTSNLACWPTQWYYDVVMTNTISNVSQRVLQGILYVNPGVSYIPNAT
jgi:hypothetical protein